MFLNWAREGKTSILFVSTEKKASSEKKWLFEYCVIGWKSCVSEKIYIKAVEEGEPKFGRIVFIGESVKLPMASFLIIVYFWHIEIKFHKALIIFQVLVQTRLRGGGVNVLESVESREVYNLGAFNTFNVTN